nr:class I SAM-dependent methyltransferase [Phenylobacterium sp.]
MADALRALATMNHRFAPQFAKTMLATPRADEDAASFAAHCKAMNFEFTEGWADQNIPFVSPLLRDFAAQRGSVRYMEIGAYEGRNLAFMDWLLPAKLDVTVIDPWFDEDLNPEEKYHAVEPRFARNTAKLGFSKLTTHKGFSTYELPRMLERGETYDLIYI